MRLQQVVKRRLSRMLAIYKKELRTYFTSMVGYVFIALFLFIIGLFSV